MAKDVKKTKSTMKRDSSAAKRKAAATQKKLIEQVKASIEFTPPVIKAESEFIVLPQELTSIRSDAEKMVENGTSTKGKINGKDYSITRLSGGDINMFYGDEVLRFKKDGKVSCGTVTERDENNAPKVWRTHDISRDAGQQYEVADKFREVITAEQETQKQSSNLLAMAGRGGRD